MALLVGLVAPAGSPSNAAAATRTAESAGSAPVGSQTYAAPSDAVYVAPWGSDGNAGSVVASLRTLNRALAVAPSSGTVVLRAGSYHEHAVVTKTVTIQNYPGEAVWLEGSTPVNGWVKDGTRWRHDGWTTRLDHSPSYTKGGSDSSAEHYRFLNSARPMAAHPDQVWIDDRPQAQVEALSDVGAGQFFLDEGSSRLYLGSDPSDRQVSSSVLPQALSIRAAGVTVQGIGIRRFAPSIWHLGAVVVEKPNFVLEHVTISESSTTGLSVLSTNAQLRRITVESSGMLGIHGRFADGLTMSGVLARRNNTELFNIAPVSGGVKLGQTRGVTVSSSSFSDNHGPGFWEDLSVYNSVFRQSQFVRNAGDGLFLEISARVVVGDSLFADNRLDGIKVNNTADVEIWNNTFVGNGRPLDLVQDNRRNTNRSDPAVDPRVSWPDPAMPWQLDDVTVGNNVVGLSTSVANCLLCVEDYSHLETGQDMVVRADGNVYVRPSASAPSWLVVWSRGPGNPYVFNSLSAFRSTTGQESRGREYVGTSTLSAAGALASGVQDVASQIALPLPSDVAGLIGQRSGSTRLGIWDSPTPAPASTPTPPDAGAVLAQDSFTRVTSNGWGSAVTGGAWTTPALTDRFRVDDGQAQIDLRAGDGLSARLAAARSSRADVRIALSVDQQPSGAGHYLSVVGRQVSDADDYRTKVGIRPDGDVSLYLSRTSTGVDQVLADARPGIGYRPGDALLVRTQVVGTHPTLIRAKVWKGGTAEPGSWTLTAEDGSSALQATGSVGVEAYTTGSASGAPMTVHFDELRVSTVQ